MRIPGAVLLALALAATVVSCAARPETGTVRKASEPTKPVAEKVSREVERDSGNLYLSPGTTIDEKRFAAMARESQYILIGESHSSVCDHQSQTELVEAMIRSGMRPVLGFEMVSRENQNVLDLLGSGDIRVDQLEDELNWHQTWGYDFAMYRPLFALGVKHKLPMVGLNLPRDIIELVSAEGLEGLTAEEALLLPEKIVPPPKAQETVLAEVFEEHEEQADATERELRKQRFFLIQSLWDSVMAESALFARLEYDRPVVVIAGQGHVEQGWGIRHRLKAFDPEARTLLVLPWRGAAGESMEGADVYYHCPPTHKSSMGMTLMLEDGRVMVVDVEERSRAALAGLEAGDVILTAGERKVEALWDLHKAGVEAHKKDIPLLISVDRDGEAVTLDLGRLGRK